MWLSPERTGEDIPMADEHEQLERRALWRARELGHTIPRIDWDPLYSEGLGTCTRCGDGVVLYVGPEVSNIYGTAYETACPGNTCTHGWQVTRLPEGGIRLRCLHCGAERDERMGEHGGARGSTGET